MIAWALFTSPLPLQTGSVLALVIPLCAAVAIVYKAIRVGNLRCLPLEVILLVAYMMAGLAALGTALWLVQRYWP